MRKVSPAVHFSVISKGSSGGFSRIFGFLARAGTDVPTSPQTRLSGQERVYSGIIRTALGLPLKGTSMRILRSRLAGFALCASLATLSATPGLLAQDQQPPQRGGRGGGMGGGGMFMMGGNNARGKVTAISGNDITIKDEQGQVYKVETGPNTRIRKDREEAKFSDIHVGDTIVAGGNLDDQAKTVGAMFVMVLTPDQAAQMEKMRAEFGKTWTTGKITAIKDLTVTIERPDKVSQTIAVDENTTFHKGMRGNATDITFPDIKVGDMLRADGSLQGGNFLATTLTVMEPRQGGQGRFGGGPRGAPGTGPGAPAANGPGSQGQQPPQPQGSSAGAAPAQVPNNPQN